MKRALIIEKHNRIWFEIKILASILVAQILRDCLKNYENIIVDSEGYRVNLSFDSISFHLDFVIKYTTSLFRE